MILGGTMTNSLANPCIRVCCLDGNDVCLGCFRKLDEILKWREYSSKEKIDILDKCKQRKRAAKCPRSDF